MWAHLQREGIPVAKSTVERLMRANGWQGVRRQKKVRTTIPGTRLRSVRRTWSTASSRCPPPTGCSSQLLKRRLA
jgi:transposase InsO family protein